MKPAAGWLALASAFAVGAAAPVWADAPAPSVVVTPVTSTNIAPSTSNVGHVIAIETVKVIPRVTAFIDQVNVRQGSTVKAGQLLFSLQPEQYEAALQMAQSSLASARAALENADLVFARAASLHASGFTAESTLDQARATRDQDRANVLSAEAQVTTAQLNLSYCRILAPIAGRVGTVALTKGNLVTTTTGALLTINQLDPIRVVFSVSSNSPILNAVASGGNAGFKVQLNLPDGAPYQYQGKIAFLDNQIDTSTGTVNVYADFQNPQSLLLPGAYVSVLTSPAQAQEALTVPVAAVQTDQNSDFVLVVGRDNKVEQRTVLLGTQIGQNFVAKSGLSAGDRVIVDGIQKVKVGQVVTTTVQPAGT